MYCRLKMNSLLAVVIGMAVLEACCASTQDEASLEVINKIQARNKKLAKEFTLEYCGDKTKNSLEKYFSPNIIEHNPLLDDGIEEAKTFIRERCKDWKRESVDIKRISAEGDLVWLHLKVNFMQQDIAIVDIYRFEDGIMVEHWDVIQPIPDKSANDHPMF